ncbi:L-xylulose reductase [Aspergillus flavus AF70]|nr:L-xylulose reductase [Aspergillus flavus AF70]
MVGIYVYNSCYFKDYVEATNIGGYLDRKTYGIWRSTPKTVVWVRPTVRFPVSILPPAEEIGNVFHGLHTETSFRRKCTTFGTGPYGGVESTIPFHILNSTQANTMPEGPVVNGLFRHNNTTPPAQESVMALFSLKGKTAVVTGAASGIGLSVAHALAEAGANVAIWYNRNSKAVEEAANIQSKYGVKCRAYQINIRESEKVEELLNTCVRELNGRLDIFIANSGIPWTQGPMIDAPLDHYRDVTQTDLDGTFYCARAAGAHWRRQKTEGTDIFGNPLQGFTYGSFIATASMSGHIVNIPQLQAAYNAAKAGVIHLCKSLAVEWVQFARANTVSPGYIITDISTFVPDETKDIWKGKIPMGREALPHELKGAYLYLASDASSYTTGADLVVDGGYTLP